MVRIKERVEIRNMEICPHGGLNYEELERWALDPSQIIDFSSSSYDFCISPQIKEALARVEIEHYPDPEARKLRGVIAKIHDLQRENVVVGNGSSELIWLIALAYLNREDKVLLPQPTFGEYEVASRIMGGRIVKHHLLSGRNFRLDIKTLCLKIKKHRPKVLFLGNPNNPTGGYLSEQEVERILNCCFGSLLVIDEAYIEFVPNAWSSSKLIGRGNIIILRSLTKAYGLAGLRLGYALGEEKVMANLRKVSPPWNVNSLAQEAAIASLFDREHLSRCLREIRVGKEYLVKELVRMGIKVFPSEANFFLVKVDDGERFRIKLLRRGFLVRNCASFGLPTFIRITARRKKENKLLIEAIRKLEEEEK